MKQFGLGTRSRLNLDRDIEKLLKTGNRTRLSSLTIYWDCPQNATAQRLAIRVSSKTAPSVKRNRVKRILREIFRLNRRGWNPSLQLLIVVRKYLPSDWAHISTLQTLLQNTFRDLGISAS